MCVIVQCVIEPLRAFSSLSASHPWEARVKRHINAMILFLACQLPIQANADQIIPFYCSLDPNQLPVGVPNPDLTFQVPASHGIVYTERSKCKNITVGTVLTGTFCYAHQSGGDPGYYRCGPKVPTGCTGLDLITIMPFSYTPNPDGTTKLCATARNAQPDNDRYVDIYFRYQQ
jgi:hypothetical protein